MWLWPTGGAQERALVPSLGLQPQMLLRLRLLLLTLLRLLLRLLRLLLLLLLLLLVLLLLSPPRLTPLEASAGWETRDGRCPRR